MQRVITDFGADHAFALVPKKLQEHYGLALSASTVRAITEYHAGQIYQTEERITGQPKSAGCKMLIGEIDGSMIPIVKVDEEAEDKRKNKTLQWQETQSASRGKSPSEPNTAGNNGNLPSIKLASVTVSGPPRR